MDTTTAARMARRQDRDWLVERFGAEAIGKRLERERQDEAGRGDWMRQHPMRRARSVKSLAPAVLRYTGMLALGRRNATRFETTRRDVAIDGLPAEFDGFRILHLTDLHGDISPLAMAALPHAIAGLDYDACVVTGDYRGLMYGPHEAAVDATERALATVRGPRFGTLGNHDSLAMVRPLEEAGLPMLVNEAVSIRRDGRRIWLAGVDDPHHYRTDDVARATAGIPPGETIVMLSHSTENHEAARAAGASLFLCGHTHGGQVCLPGGIPMTTSTRMPRRMASGAWRSGAMQGYTSRGVGSSMVEARISCPPEVAIHTLRTA